MPTSRGPSRRPALALAALLLGFVVALSACVTAEGTLRANGSGTLELTYRPPPTSTETLEKRRFASPDVTLDSLQMKDDGSAVAKLRFDDPAKLSTLEIFRAVKVERRREGQDERLAIVITNAPVQVRDPTKAGPTIRLSLPGKVVEANRNATVEGSTVTWRFGLADFLKERSVDLNVRYAGTAAP